MWECRCLCGASDGVKLIEVSQERSLSQVLVTRLESFGNGFNLGYDSNVSSKRECEWSTRVRVDERNQRGARIEWRVIMVSQFDNVIVSFCLRFICIVH